MRAQADLWNRRNWNTPAGVMVYWLKRALKPGASELAKGAAKCFYSIALQRIGEVETRRALELADLSLPDWLKDVPPAAELVRQQRQKKSEKVSKKENVKVAGQNLRKPKILRQEKAA